MTFLGAGYGWDFQRIPHMSAVDRPPARTYPAWPAFSRLLPLTSFYVSGIRMPSAAHGEPMTGLDAFEARALPNSNPGTDSGMETVKTKSLR